MPCTEHSLEILAGSWPSQSVMAWSGYSMAWSQMANTLFTQLDVQMDIKTSLVGMDGYLVDTLRQLAQGRETTLQNRIEAYRAISHKAHLAASELQNTKTELADIVNTTEQDIRSLRDQAKVEKALMPAAAPAIDAFVEACIQAAVAAAKAQAQARDLQGATTVTALSHDIAKWAEPYINSKMPTGGAPEMGNMPAAPAPALPTPASPQMNGNTKPVDYTTSDNLRDANPSAQSAKQTDTKSDAQQNQKNIQQTGMRTDDPAKEAAVQQKPSNPSPSSSAPSSPASSGGGSSSGSSPASGIAHMMRPASAGSSSPASSSPASSGAGGGSNPASAAQSSQLANAKPSPAGGVPGGANAAAAGAGGAGRAPGLASLGSGIAESSARLASGAVNTASNVAANAANVGSNVAQNVVSQAAGQVGPTAPAAASTMPAAVSPGGGAPMGMMPATGGGVSGGPATVTPVTSTPAGTPAVGGGPAATAAAGPTAASSFGGATPQAAAGSQLAPIPLDQGRGVRGIGADGSTGDVLFGQAMDVGRDVVSSMVAQTLGTGYITIHYAVALVYERGGMVSAWMATSEGASYIPLGVRVPADVRMSVNDPIVGHELWERSAASGGANPLDVVVRQAQARELAAPGSRVLAIASSLPLDQVMDYASEVGARPVSVDPKSLAPITTPNLAMAHRCAVAMPWEWRQANAFGAHDRMQVAQRQMHMAVSAGRLSSGAAEEVMDLFELGQPIQDTLWRDVEHARFMSLIEYEMAIKSAGHGGADPARALASARAAEVVLCLRNHATAEGCADLLYATRLAGAPLEMRAAAV